MKKIIFFDLDNTLHSTKKKEIPSQTIELLNYLASLPNVELGLATGRGPSKIHMIDELIHLFTYKIFINGSIAYINDKLVYQNPISVEDMKNVVKLSEERKVSTGFVALDTEYISEINNDVDYGLKGFNQDYPLVDNLAYLRVPIYQMWLFSKDINSINEIVSKVDLNCYPWHQGGADLVSIDTNKATAIKKVLENQTDYQLITVGDGHNDIQMIELADIGIAMGNTGFEELRKKADYIAPHIDDNQLFDFIKKINIFS